MKVYEVLQEDGRIVKGVNTTVDVGPNEIKTQAAKFGNTVDKDGKPPTLSKKVKGKSTNVLFNLGLAEGYKLKLERDEEIDVLHIVDTKTKKRIEVRGKKGYETDGYDPQDKLHQVLDKVGRSANVSELMNGNVVSINPKHPQGADAEKTAKDVLTTEAKSADLYHSTHDDESFVNILKSGAIKPNFDHEHTTEKDPRPYISLSRDKKFDMFGSLPITLVIDQTKLANSHKIVPYDSFASDDDFEKRSSGSSEAEERVYKSIPISYIKYVILRNANWVDSEAVLAAAKAANIPVVDLNGQPIKENFAKDVLTTEALDNPYPFNLQGPNTNNTYFAKAQTANGELVMEFDGGYDDFSIDFAVGNSMGKTEAGDEFRVFATVVAMMNEWIDVVGIEHVESFDFGANKDDHASDGRAKLYARFAKKLASQLGWSLQQSSAGNNSTEFFSLINPKAIPRPEGYFDAIEDGELGPNGEIPAQYNESGGNMKSGKNK